jgi:hypothetical protein
MRNLLARAILILGFSSLAATAHAQLFGDSGAPSPRVPVSAFARPAAWLDPSRLQITQEFSFGTGFGGGPSSGLSVTRFQYQIGDPLAVRVSVGNAFGGLSAGGASPFLEGLDLSYRPFQSMLIQVRYQDVRSPLQFSRGEFPWR